MIGAFIIAACAILNRLRGDDGWMPSWLRGRALWYVAPAIAALAWPLHPWPVALGFGAAYLFWAVFGWGHVFGRLGGFQPDRSPDVVEAALLMLPGRILPAFARMLFVMPGAVLLAALSGDTHYIFAGMAFAVLATSAYALFLCTPRRIDWLRSEVAAGAAWGLMIVGAAL